MQFDKDCLTSRLSVRLNLIQKCFTFYWFTSAFEATQRLMLLSFKSLDLSSISFRLFSICLQHLFTTSHWRFFRAAICMPHAIRSATHCCVKKEEFYALSGALELQLLLQFLCHPIHFQLAFSSSHAITASDRSCQKINERYFLSRRIMKRRWNWFTSLLEPFVDFFSLIINSGTFTPMHQTVDSLLS